MLFTLNGKDRLKTLAEGKDLEDDSCTSKPCRWIVPRSAKPDPRPVGALTFAKPKIQQEEHTKASSIDYDPRHFKDRRQDFPRLLVSLNGLKQIFPNSGLFSSCLY